MFLAEELMSREQWDRIDDKKLKKKKSNAAAPRPEQPRMKNTETSEEELRQDIDMLRDEL